MDESFLSQLQELKTLQSSTEEKLNQAQFQYNQSFVFKKIKF